MDYKGILLKNTIQLVHFKKHIFQLTLQHFPFFISFTGIATSIWNHNKMTDQPVTIPPFTVKFSNMKFRRESLGGADMNTQRSNFLSEETNVCFCNETSLIYCSIVPYGFHCWMDVFRAGKACRSRSGNFSGGWHCMTPAWGYNMAFSCRICVVSSWSAFPTLPWTTGTRMFVCHLCVSDWCNHSQICHLQARQRMGIYWWLQENRHPFQQHHRLHLLWEQERIRLPLDLAC